MFAEIAGGLWSGSLALLSDAAHMLMDAAALALALVAFRLSRRPPDRLRSYGYHRLPVLAAFTNGITLLLIVLGISIEAARRLLEPGEVLATPMLLIAVLGLLVNIVSFAILREGAHHNLNMRGAATHVLGDILGSLAAIVAAIIILSTGWTPIDPILSLVVAGIVLRSAWPLVRDSAHVLLEGTPNHINVEEISADLTDNIAAVENIHHVHAWSLSEDKLALTLHARLSEGAKADNALRDIHRRLSTQFGASHCTVQIEMSGCADDSVTSPARQTGARAE